MEHIAECENLVYQILFLLLDLSVGETNACYIEEVSLMVSLLFINTFVLESILQLLAPIGA